MFQVPSRVNVISFAKVVIMWSLCVALMSSSEANLFPSNHFTQPCHSCFLMFVCVQTNVLWDLLLGLLLGMVDAGCSSEIKRSMWNDVVRKWRRRNAWIIHRTNDVNERRNEVIGVGLGIFEVIIYAYQYINEVHLRRTTKYEVSSNSMHLDWLSGAAWCLDWSTSILSAFSLLWHWVNRFEK